jgi:anhydro-N-acetylmuramic acid kinase
MAQSCYQESIFMHELYIGLMSGTSLDGIDAAVVDFNQEQPILVAKHYVPYTADFRQRLLDLCQPGEDEVNRLGELDCLLGKQFALAINTMLQQNEIRPENIRAIGSHGQSIRHHPQRGFTLQIGDPNVIAAETGITTIADFRRRDIALGGQGAPLVPAFHQAVFSHPHVNRVIVNIGGIANITLLPADQTQPVLGFDTGPGNTLLDAWAGRHLKQPRDDKGLLASQGNLQPNLLNTLLDDSFFKLTAPKSTGREYFNLEWLESKLSLAVQPADVQTTLVELTAQSILAAIKLYFSSAEIFICGGGIHNVFLMERLRDLAKNYLIESTEKLGIPPDWIEAVAFAWLAKQTLAHNPGNLKSVTGAKRASILGGIYFA